MLMNVLFAMVVAITTVTTPSGAIIALVTMATR